MNYSYKTYSESHRTVEHDSRITTSVFSESFPNQAENHSEINIEHSKHARSEENPITSCLIPREPTIYLVRRRTPSNLLGSEKNFFVQFFHCVLLGIEISYRTIPKLGKYPKLNQDK